MSINHKIWQIAWPAILSNISTPLLGLVDTAILGHLDSTRYLGAVAIGASILSFLYWGFGFLRMGTTGLVARAAGANDSAQQLTVVLQSGILALLLAALVVASQAWWLVLGINLMAPPPEIAGLASEYASIRVFSAPAVLVTYTIMGWFIGRQNTRWPMLILIATNVLNILLDLLFIVVLDWKSAGAAWATLVSEYAGCALALAVAGRQLDWAMASRIQGELRRLRAYGALLRNNQYLFIRTLCLLYAFAFFTAMSTRLGETTLAANTIMLNLMMFAAFGLDGFAYAAEGLAGNAAGAADPKRFFESIKACAIWTATTACLISMTFLLFGPSLYPLITDHADVIAVIDGHALWLAALPLIAAPSYLLDGIFIGAARTRYMMIGMALSLGLIYLPAAYSLKALGNHGLWLAFTLFNGSRGITLWFYFRRLSHKAAWFN